MANWDTERSSDLANIKQLVSHRARIFILDLSDSKVHALFPVTHGSVLSKRLFSWYKHSKCTVAKRLASFNNLSMGEWQRKINTTWVRQRFIICQVPTLKSPKETYCLAEERTNILWKTTVSWISSKSCKHFQNLNHLSFQTDSFPSIL